jgi:hypothetical protein
MVKTGPSFSRDEEAFLETCRVIAAGPARWRRAFGDHVIVVMPGFPRASRAVREQGRAIIEAADQSNPSDAGEVRP